MSPTEKNNPPYLSVVLPAYNASRVAGENLSRLRQHLDTLGLSHELIVVDDGSNDAQEMEQLANSLDCRFLCNERNLGKGAAVRRGMLAATGKFRIFTDIDVPYELESIERALYYLDLKEFHMVAGDRTLVESSYFKEVSRLRKSTSHVYSRIVGNLIVGGWYDTQCGFKGFRDHVVEDIFGVSRIERFAIDVELFYLALKRNYDIKRIPVRLRNNETSSVRVIRDGMKMVADLARIRWYQAAGRYRPQSPVIRTVDLSPSELRKRLNFEHH